MSRRVAAASTAAILACLLAGCTAPPATAPDPASTGSAGSGGGAGAGRLPSCEAITAAIGSLVDGLSYDAQASEDQTHPEAYEQRVCVYLADDGVTQLGVTIAGIPFQQAEIDSYTTLPNAIADDRLAAYQAVLQTFEAGDGDDGHLDSALYLFDTAYSITVQGLSTEGPTTETLPQLTVPAATEAAFAVRALIN